MSGGYFIEANLPLRNDRRAFIESCNDACVDCHDNKRYAIFIFLGIIVLS